MVIDWYTRKVLSLRVSNTLDTVFCLEAVQEAIDHYGTPEIFNTDQGSQFTSAAFTDLMKVNGIRISMDGKGSWRDNVFIERLCEPSSTRRCTSKPMNLSRRPGPHLSDTSLSTILGVHIHDLTARPPIRSTLTNCLYPGQLNQARQESTYTTDSTVQRTGATSVFSTLTSRTFSWTTP